MTAPARIGARAAAAGLLLVLAGCGGGGGGGGGGGPPPPLIITTATLADGVVGDPYSQVISANGGTGGRNYSISAGALPAGLTFAANGTITGTPSGPAGVANVTIAVTDSGSPQQTDSQALSVEIADPLVVNVGVPPQATIGVPYSHSIAASGGTPPYFFAISSVSGLSVDANGQISGTPQPLAITSVLGGFVADSATPQQIVDTNFRIVVTLEALSTTMPDATAGTEYHEVLQARGGRPPYGWAIVGGSLPPGINHGFLPGHLIGNATAACSPVTSTFDARVNDVDTPQQSDTQTGITLTAFKGVLSIPAAGLPVGQMGQGYSGFIQAALGVAPYSYAVTVGALPAGLNLQGPTGQIFGVPTSAGSASFTIQATDACGTTATRAYTLVVGGPAQGRNDSIPTATVIGNGVFFASISPSGHPNTVFDPDEDYYSITTTAASTVTVDLNAQGGGIDTVIEIVNAGGTRLATCGSPAFTSACVNDDETPRVQLDSFLQLRVNGPTTFFVRVVEWRGDARPDLQYTIEISGVN